MQSLLKSKDYVFTDQDMHKCLVANGYFIGYGGIHWAVPEGREDRADMTTTEAFEHLLRSRNLFVGR
jgi:hypothetical protein